MSKLLCIFFTAAAAVSEKHNNTNLLSKAAQKTEQAMLGESDEMLKTYFCCLHKFMMLYIVCTFWFMSFFVRSLGVVERNISKYAVLICEAAMMIIEFLRCTHKLDSKKL